MPSILVARSTVLLDEVGRDDEMFNVKRLTIFWVFAVLISQSCFLVAAKATTQKLLSLEQARIYMLGLVNKDRIKHGLRPLRLDPTASVAGQMHANEMAIRGYLSHWDSFGRKPAERYTFAGGSDSVGENLYLASTTVFSGSEKRVQNSGTFRVMTQPCFSTADLEDMQKKFMDEVPPEDGHRVQILAPEHNKVGFGLCFSQNEAQASRLALAQEFVNAYGEYLKLPNTILRGHPFDVAGSLDIGMKIYSVSICWEPQPKPMSTEELISSPRHASYTDDSIITFFPTERKKLKTWISNGRSHFSVSVTPTDSWKSGLYYVSICAMEQKTKDLFEISLRTVHLN